MSGQRCKKQSKGKQVAYQNCQNLPVGFSWAGRKDHGYVPPRNIVQFYIPKIILTELMDSQHGKFIFQYSAIFASIFNQYIEFVKRKNNLRFPASK